MVNTATLKRLLSHVEFRPEYNVVEGIDEFRDLLEYDSNGVVLRFLQAALRKLSGQERGGIVYVIAEHYRKTGDVKKLRQLIDSDDECVRESVLNALWDAPGSNPDMGPAIVQMAIDAANDTSPEVRTEVSRVLQNQSGRGIDVSAGIAPLRSLLKDRDHRVRHQAGYAVGNLAKAKYDMSSCIARLRRNLKHKDMYVRESNAWALWQMSRHKHDISTAVPELTGLLADSEDYNEHRKNAAGALIHHAKKSSRNANDVKASVCAVALDEKRNEINKFVEQLEKLK